MKMWRILTMAIVLVIVSVPLIARFTIWISPATRTVLFALAPPVAVAFVLVLYFNWRARLKSHILPGDRADELASAV
jgi:hypothetical protein